MIRVSVVVTKEGKGKMSRINLLTSKIKIFNVYLKNRRIKQNISNFIDLHRNDILPPKETIILPEVIIPCFNHGKYIETAIKSIPKDIPLTIVNDASTDNTHEILTSIKPYYSFKVITNSQNQNQSGSINRAINESNNNLFIILNADDALVKYWIDTVLNLFNKNENIRLLGGNAIPFSDENLLNMNNILSISLGYIPKPRIFTPSDARFFSHLNAINMTMSGCSFLKSAWLAVDGFWDYQRRVCSYDDRDFQMRVNTLFDIAILDEPSAFYRTNSSLGKAQE